MATWRGQVYVPRVREMDAVPTSLQFDYEPDALYFEKQSLIDALEQWLQSKEYWGQLRLS